MKQVVVFTWFKDTLDDIVGRLRAIETGLLIGTYSGQGGRYVDPATRDWIGVERDEPSAVITLARAMRRNW